MVLIVILLISGGGYSTAQWLWAFDYSVVVVISLISGDVKLCGNPTMPYLRAVVDISSSRLFRRVVDK